MAVKFAADESFESYSARFAEHFKMTRKNGVIEVCMHENGDSPRWSYELHRAIPAMYAAVGADRENEVMILTSVGDFFLKEFNAESFGISHDEFIRRSYDIWYLDGTKLQESILWSTDIPVIAVINGPGFHFDIPLLADLTICAPNAKFMEGHTMFGMVPGDGLFLILQELLGIKRANHLALMHSEIDAAKALELGLINEVLPRDQAMVRAREMAAHLMKNNRVVRGLTTQVLRRRWKRVFTDDFNMHFAHELFASVVSETRHDNETVKTRVNLDDQKKK